MFFNEFGDPQPAFYIALWIVAIFLSVASFAGAVWLAAVIVKWVLGL